MACQNVQELTDWDRVDRPMILNLNSISFCMTDSYIIYDLSSGSAFLVCLKSYQIIRYSLQSYLSIDLSMPSAKWMQSQTSQDLHSRCIMS